MRPLLNKEHHNTCAIDASFLLIIKAWQQDYFYRTSKQQYRSLIPIIKSTLLKLAFILCCSLSFASAASSSITVILSHDEAPYREVLKGVAQLFKTQQLDISLDVHIFDNNADHNAAIKAASERNHSRAILSLGSKATEFAQATFPQLPLCAGLIVDTQALSKTANATALILKFPLATELQWLTKFIGTERPIAILYNERQNAQEISQLSALAAQYHLQLHLKAVNHPDELPGILQYLPNDIAAVWSFADAGILNAQTAQQVLLYSFRNRVPLIGLSKQWTKAGALYALDRDYVDVGKQCAEKLIQLLNGTPARKLSNESPRKVLYSINQRTVEHMKLDLPEALLRGAHEIY